MEGACAVTEELQDPQNTNERLEQEIAARARLEKEMRACEAALRESEQRFHSFMDNSPALAFMKDEAGRYIYVSRTCERRFQSRREDWIGKTDADLWSSDNVRRLYDHDQEVLAGDDGAQRLELVQDEQGNLSYWLISKFPWHDAAGRKLIAGVAVELTEQKRTEEALRLTEEKYRAMFENAIEGIFQAALDGSFMSVNAALARLCGDSSPEELMARITDIRQQLYVDPARCTECCHLLEQSDFVQGFEAQLHRRDGEAVWVTLNVRAVRDAGGTLLHYEGSVQDVSLRKSTEAQLLHSAFHDRLTALPNRALFMDRLSQAIAHGKRHPDYLFAVLFMDFDRFKVVNDSLGHAVGDELLVSLARRLDNCRRPGDTVARLGGDEFAVLLDDIKDAAAPLHAADRIQSQMHLPFQLGKHLVYTSASIGIALSTTGYGQAEEVLRDADIAMYRAKAQGKARYEVFDSTMHSQAMALMELESDLRRAVERHEFLNYYQPIVSLTSGQVAGFEALVRWQHPTRGLVSPLEFIPIAEETGLIIPIGQWVLREACRQLSAWLQQTPEPRNLYVSVNLSGKQCAESHLVAQVEKILREHDLHASNLKLEITESMLMTNTDSVAATLTELKNLGVLLGMDDFGTGYSSLSYLHRFPLDMLKIDRSFISRVGPGGQNSEIVRTIVALAHNLGMDVVAEGVETAEQLSWLRTLQCQHSQGYLFAKPMDGAAAQTLIEAQPQW